MSDALTQFVLSNLLVSSMLAIGAWGVHRSGTRPFIAHVLWLIVLVKLVTPPVVSIPVVSLPEIAPSTLAAGIGDEHTASASIEAVGLTPTDERGPARTILARESEIATWSPWAIGARFAVAVFWVVGSACVLAWTLVRIVRFHRRLRAASRVASSDLQQSAAEIAQRLGLRRAPTIFTVSARISPLVWWVGGRVRVLIPEDLVRALDARELRWILAHELAHVRRRDHLVRWLEWLTCVAFWWNPVAWWARRNLRINEEVCCDALVLASFEARAQSYAGALMSVVEYLALPALRPPAVASEITSGGLLERRLRMIVSMDRMKRRSGWIRAGVAGLALAITPLGIAAYAPADDDPVADVLRDGVSSGALSAEEARVIFETAVFPGSEIHHLIADKLARTNEEIERAVESGRITRDEADAKMRAMDAHMHDAMEMAFATEVLGLTKGEAHLALAKAKINRAVAAGELTAEEAEKKLHEMRRGLALEREHEAHLEKAAQEIRRKVEAGEMTPEEGRARMAQIRNGVERRVRYRAASEEIKALVAAGRITDVEATARLQELRARMAAASGRTDIDWEGVKRRIEGAVERGDMTRAEADATYKKLRERVARAEQDRAEGHRDDRGDRDVRGDRHDHDGIRIRGRITEVGRGSIVVALERRGEVQVVATDRTRITRNGERARLSDLHVGDGVGISGVADRTRDHVVIRAREIHARGR